VTGRVAALAATVNPEYRFESWKNHFANAGTRGKLRANVTSNHSMVRARRKRFMARCGDYNLRVVVHANVGRNGSRTLLNPRRTQTGARKHYDERHPSTYSCSFFGRI